MDEGPHGETASKGSDMKTYRRKKQTLIQKLFAQCNRYKKATLIPLAIACALSVVPMQPIDACGPFSRIAIFVNGLHPDFPLKRFAAGELGVLNPDYARSYLVVAYRYLSGIKTPTEKQNEFVVLWDRRLQTLDVDVQDAIAEWINERKKVVKAPAKDVDAYQVNAWSGYLTYNVDAFKTATQTLRNKIQKFGADDPRVKDWLKAQDQVFGIPASSDSASTGSGSATTSSGSASAGSDTTTTSSDSASTEPAAPTSDTEYDAAYQKACEDFYEQRYDAAAEKFQAIAANTNSPWQPWGDYLAARSYCRKATMGDELKLDDLKKAKACVEKVLQSKNPKMQEPAKRLMSFIDFRLDPNERAKQVVAALTHEGGNEDLTEALGDYTILLDKVLEKQTSDTNTGALPNQNGSVSISSTSIDDRKRADSLDFTILSYAALSGLLTFGGHRIWCRVKGNRKTVIPTSTIVAAVSLSALSLTLVACTQTTGVKLGSSGNADTTVATKANDRAVLAQAGAASSKLPSPGDVVFDDDMTAWILNFQDHKAASLNKALEVWDKSKSVPWLVSVVSKISANHPRKAEVVAEAEKLSPSSPAYLTTQYHLVRLLLEENKPKEAASLLGSVLAKVGPNIPPSARNGLFQMGVVCAGSLPEFVKMAAPSPAVVTWDYDCSEMPESSTDDESGRVKLKTDGKYLSYAGCLTSKAAEIINEVTPIQTYVALASNSTLPPLVRLDIAQAGWVRSVMLKNEKMAMTLSPVLGKLRPQLVKSLSDYDAARSGTEKDFAGLTTILRNPRMRPYVTPGLDRETAFNKIDSFRNNWWSDSLPTAPQNMYADEDESKKKRPPTTTAFLTDAEMAQGKKESAAIVAQGTAPNSLAERVLALSKANPKDPRLAEMLHLVVTTTRYGNTDDKTTAFSKQAFQALHKNFPGNQWTQKTKFWF